MLPFRRHLLGLALLSAARGTTALTQSYCSSDNTGSDLSAVFDIYQSNGACQTSCQAEYAFAVVQYQNCWCSNYIPASQEDVSNCSQNCPGFPSEQCGNESEGLYGYVALTVEPSGTAGASSASSTSSRRTTSTTSSTTSTTSTRPQSTAQPTPVTSIIQTTVSGEAVTLTVTSTPTLAPNSSQETVSVERNEGLSGGTVAGIVIGVVAGLAIIAAAAFLLWRRKKNAEAAEAAGAGAGSSSKKNMTRNVSVLSKAGLLSRGARPSMGERDHDDAFAANGSGSVRHSMLFGPGAEGVSPASPLGSSHGESGSSRRPSKPMVYDQRLNPSALFSNTEANGSRISMQDTQDYSRPLGITNPDPRPSFESRTSNYRA